VLDGANTPIAVPSGGRFLLSVQLAMARRSVQRTAQKPSLKGPFIRPLGSLGLNRFPRSPKTGAEFVMLRAFLRHDQLPYLSSFMSDRVGRFNAIYELGEDDLLRVRIANR
jgi:hypothetical protein